MEVNKVAEEWEIWDEEEKVAKSEEEAKKLAPQRFYKWIFGKKASKKMPMKKLQNHAIGLKKIFKEEEGIFVIKERERRDT